VSLESARDRLETFVHDIAATWAVPGIAVGVTDRKRTIAVVTYGQADDATGAPVTPTTLFQIGSISKSFAAFAVMREVEAGRLDLHAPATEYLPWLPLRPAGEPVAIHHLLSHTSGLPAGTEATPSTVGEALRLARIEPDPPGTYHYSNLGYSIVGLVLECVCGEPIAEVLRSRVLEPARMTATEPVITHAIRSRLATGYASADPSRPWHPGLPLAPATWVETDSAAGSVSSSVEDMCAYARLLLNGGKGVVSPASFERMTAPIAEAEEGYTYGYGLYGSEREGRRLVGHDGAMVGFSSSLDADVTLGIGAVALCNSIDLAFVPSKLVAAALELVGAAIEGRDLPDLPTTDRGHVPDGSAYAGTYRAGTREVVVRDRARLFLDRDGTTARLERVESDVFYPVGAEPAAFFIRFGREDGQVVELYDGPDWYVREDHRSPCELEVPDAWHAYVGTYGSFSPWVPGFRVFVRKGTLVALAPPGVEAVLEPLGEGRFRAATGEEVVPRHVAFGDVIDGRAARATCDGADLYRVFSVD
jgi:CubicO group peptidase (beta-lactamase class C family)